MPRKPKPDQLPLIIRQLIRKREFAGITKQELADRLGYSFDTVYQWENGRIHPSFQSLMNWCQFFDVVPTLTERQ